MPIKPLVAAALALGCVAVAPEAAAQRYGHGAPDMRYQQPDRGGYEAARGDDARRYDARAYRRCNDGTTGTLLGALAGGLIGHSVTGRGDRVAGTVVGAGAGALAGRAIERSNNSGYCR